MVFLPRSLRFVIRHIGHPISEPEVKYVFLLLFGLGALRDCCEIRSVLPAIPARTRLPPLSFIPTRRWSGRVRGVAFTFLTPFFFLRAGTLIELPAVIAGSPDPFSCCSGSRSLGR